MSRRSHLAFLLLFVGALLSMVAAVSEGAITVPTVPVGDAGNAGQLTGANALVPGQGNGPQKLVGAVSYTYNIGKYEVTAGQYTSFLNAVGANDTYGLYNPSMWSDAKGCKIQRSGSAGSYTYSVASDYANRPVNYVSTGDAFRFANWLHNGQPVGAQDMTTTEDGAYFVNGETTASTSSLSNLNAVTRKDGWRWALANEDEWYKAAYYKGGSTNAGYWLYPTRSDTEPTRESPAGGSNSANFFGPPMGGGYLDSTYYRTEVGAYTGTYSPYGAYDMAGNLTEWNETLMDIGFMGPQWIPGNRGSTYFGDNPWGSGNLIRSDARWNDTMSSTRASENAWAGFRLVEVPEPASLALLGLSFLGLIRRRSCLRT